MASAIVASTSATTSPTSTTAAVAKNDEGDVDHEGHIGASSSTAGVEGDTTVSMDVTNCSPGAVGHHCDAKPLIDNGNQNQNRQKRDGSRDPATPSENIHSKETREVGNEYTKRPSSSSSSPEAKNNSELSERTVATSGKGFGEGPLPRELRRIILEVAKTGKCSWLSWNQETTKLSNKRKDKGIEISASSSLNPSSGNVHRSAGDSKSSSLTKVASSSSSQYSPSFATTGAGGGIVRKQPSFSGGSAATRRSPGLPARKRHRNGVVHKGGERMRFGNPDGAFSRSSVASNSRKRPLVSARTNSGTGAGNSNSNCNAANNPMGSASKHNNSTTSSFPSTTPGGLYSSAPSSVGSGRSTGSEPDYDSAQYECDSEGTSATTNSEISVRKTTRAKRSGAANTQGTQINSGVETCTDTAATCEGEDENNSVDGKNSTPGSPYKTLQMAFRGALGLVLDHFYQNRNNGYKLSPAEKRRNERFAETLNKNGNISSTDGSNSVMKSDKLSSLLSSEYVFQQRRQRLMAMLLPTISEGGHEKQIEEPPFTIQRIAEVLVAPDRYYTQTHKLCNCLERLLLVNSSTHSFGGSTGGDTSQRRREERELAALADEKGRQESKLQQRRLANRKSSSDEFMSADSVDPFSVSRGSSNNGYLLDELPTSSNSTCKVKSGSLAARSEKDIMATNDQPKRVVSSSSDSSTPREVLDALNRTKFDHAGTETLHIAGSNANERDVRAIAENRGLTNSPPLPGLHMAPSVAPGPNITVPNHGDVNGHAQQRLSEQQQNDDNTLEARSTSPILFSPGNDSNLDATATNIHMLQYHHAVALAGVSLNRSNNASPMENLMTIDDSTISQMRHQLNSTSTGPGSESTDGRSSASNSDIDSESDDISFDDSASDRSDGSDSGSTSAHHEPFTAARAMALNRMQQQQRLQSRVLASFGTAHQAEGFRPPADSEYQSGDSIDSTKAEDSGGSDSSSSDLAD